MSSKSATEAFENLAISMREEDGVSFEPTALVVHGKMFAFLEGDDLVVELPVTRAADLIHRGIAKKFVSSTHPSRKWVRINDTQRWSELASEAHEYVGEPAVGGES